MKDIWLAYQSATPFFVAHLIVALWVVVDLVAILKEGRVLNQGRAAWPSGRLGRMLSQQLRSSSTASRDQLVMQMADEMIDAYHNRLTLLLLIGIAGTFFGVFSLSSANPETKDIYAQFLKVLNNAVPVGFFGIVFAVSGYVIGGYPISLLRNAVADALNSDEAQHEPDNDPWKGIQQTLEEAVKLLRTSLAPLSGVESVLAESLKPVVEKLDANLTQTHTTLTTHFTEIGGTLERFRSDLAKLEQPLQQLGSTSSQMTGALNQIEHLVQSFEQSLQKRLIEYSTLDALYSSAIATLKESSAGLVAFPADLKAAMISTFTQVEQQAGSVLEAHSNNLADALTRANEQLTASGNRASTSIENAASMLVSGSNSAFQTMTTDWRSIVQSYSTSVAGTTVTANQQIASASVRAGEAIEAAAGTLTQFSANAGERLSQGIAQGAEILRAPLVELHSAIRSEFPDAIREGSDAIDRGLQHGEQLAHGLSTVGILTRNIQEGIRGWEEFSRSARQLSADWRQMSSQIEEALRELRLERTRKRTWFRLWRR